MSAVLVRAGKIPRGRSQSPLALCTQTTSAIGKPQNSVDNPRTSRPSELSSSGCGVDSVTPSASNGEVGVFLESTLIIIQQAHSLRGLQLVRFNRLIDLRLHLALQLCFVVLHRR